ncbi:hypothetical protein [Micromonospora sp. C28ISP2-4]|uniref:hypothetical protein n=1 Tax=Micromonospora sp. C28ISP2-4 TaxID=3059523 RepID=UPI0026751448|nr:hypothetical protein [Micromonospora sp. C28ISP2-4]MDO3683255.1 hypothetical protein [Micromonospora sp. C28ISP2-4]
MTSGSSHPPGDKAGQARDAAVGVGRDAKQAGAQLSHQALDQGREVVAETSRQARNLVEEAAAQARQQAEQQQRRAADGLRALGGQLRSMADDGHQEGIAADLVRRGADAAQQAAGWLDNRQPGDLLDEIRNYGRSHPGTFLAGAAVAGLLAGRLTRALSGGQNGSSSQQPGPPQEHPDDALHAPPSAGARPYVRQGPTGHEVGP